MMELIKWLRDDAELQGIIGGCDASRFVTWKAADQIEADAKRIEAYRNELSITRGFVADEHLPALDQALGDK